jgi:hypothetical protein
MTIHDDNDYSGIIGSLIYLCQRKTIVEIGVAAGSTTKVLCENAAKVGGHVYGFDVWERHGLYNQFDFALSKELVEERLTKLGFSNFTMTKIDSKTDEFTELLGRLCPQIDLAFIDGCHSYEGIKNDFLKVFPLLSKDGIVVFHDTLKIAECRKFLIDLRLSNDGTYDIVDFPWGYYGRRCGISLLVKRSYPLLNIPIDEVCDIPCNNQNCAAIWKELQEYENKWYQSELK